MSNSCPDMGKAPVDERSSVRSRLARAASGAPSTDSRHGTSLSSLGAVASLIGLAGTALEQLTMSGHRVAVVFVFGQDSKPHVSPTEEALRVIVCIG